MKPSPDVDDMRSIMLERLSTVAARGGLEMEEKLKILYGCADARACSFLWSSDPDYQLYKKIIAQYTHCPPPPTPPAQNCFDASQTSFVEEVFLSSFSVGIPQLGMMRKELGIIKFTAQFAVR